MRLLKIDMDLKANRMYLKANETFMSKWIETRRYILHKLGYDIERISIFETKRGLHIYIKLSKNIDDETANLLQFLLGDDQTRVKINQWRIKRGIKRWNKLFHKVLYRRKPKTLQCYYCGNIIPVPNRWFEDEKDKLKAKI